MNIETLHHSEIPLIQQIQAIRSPWLDNVMMFLNNFDSAGFFILLIISVWYMYDQKLGIRLFYLFLLSVFVNLNIKELLAQPRPFHFNPEVSLLSVTLYGFPSGAAQAFFVTFGFLAYSIRKWWVTLACISMILLISFSRVYLGVHFPTDILGGWFLGAILLIGYIWLLPSIESLLSRQSKTSLVLMSVGATLVLSLLSLDVTILRRVVSGLGVSLGLIATPLLPPPKSWFQRISRTLIALAGAYLFQILPSLISNHSVPFSVACSFVSGFWVSFVVPIFFRKVKFQKEVSQ